MKKRTEDWCVDLLTYRSTGLSILLPGHVVHSFICMLESLSSPSSTPAPTFDLMANILSDVSLHRDCPSTLLQALASTHTMRKKEGIKSLSTFCCISLGEYRTLHKKGAPKAIPTMCILKIKKDEQLMPL